LNPLLPLLAMMMLAIGACSKPQPPTTGFYPAVANGDIEQIKRHLFWHTKVNQLFPNGDTPLHLAVRNGDPAIVQLLIEAGADPRKTNLSGESVLETALKNRRMRIAERLIAVGAPFEGDRLLFEMVNAGVSDRDVYRLLARHGARFDVVDANGKTPLLLAIEQERPALVKQLILHGADVNQPGRDGTRPLTAANRLGAERIAQLLKANGAK